MYSVSLYLFISPPFTFITDETNYFYTWFFNENILKLKKQNYYVLFRNGTLRLPPDEKISGSYRCKINANTTAVISESITVEYPGEYNEILI